MMYSDTLYLLDKEFMERQERKKRRKQMTSEVFNTHLRYMQEATVGTLAAKAAEYATDGDRLHNFKVAAATQGITPIKALGGMMCKHTVSVYDMIGTGETYPLPLWEEKIKDSINYLYLLWALVNMDVQLANRGWKEDVCDLLDDVMDALDDAPTVDAVEVVHGRWIEHPNVEIVDGKPISNYECSECCCFYRTHENYCGFCGAKMDGERREGK